MGKVLALMSLCLAACVSAPFSPERPAEPDAPASTPVLHLCGRTDLTVYASGWALSANGALVFDVGTCRLAATIPPCYFWPDEGLLACP